MSGKKKKNNILYYSEFIRMITSQNSSSIYNVNFILLNVRKISQCSLFRGELCLDEVHSLCCVLHERHNKHFQIKRNTINNSLYERDYRKSQ